VLDFDGAADHKKRMPRNLMGILGVANCCSIEISKKKGCQEIPIEENWNVENRKSLCLKKRTNSHLLKIDYPCWHPFWY